MFRSASLTLLKAIPRDVETLIKGNIKRWKDAAERNKIPYNATEKERKEIEAIVLNDMRPLRGEAFDGLRTIRQEAVKHKNGVERDIAAELSYPTAKDTTEELLRATAGQTAWNRMVRLFDQEKGQRLTDTVKRFAEAALRSGDEHTIQALLAELPTYMDARSLDGSNSTGIIGASHVSPLAVVKQLLSDARPDVKEALAVEAELPRGMARVLANIEYGALSFQQMRPTTTIVEWDGTTTKLDLQGLDTVPLPKIPTAQSEMKIALELRYAGERSAFETDPITPFERLEGEPVDMRAALTERMHGQGSRG